MNIFITRNGGMIFWRIGRISGSICIQSEDAYWTWVQKRMDMVTLKALASI